MAMEDCIRDIMMNGIPNTWCDTLNMQSLYTLEQKGWRKKMIWKQSTVLHGSIGVFADEDIQNGETVIRYTNMKNLIVLKSADDIPPLTKSTIEYFSNYVFQTEDVCALCIPGSSVNHDKSRANNTLVKISENELAVIATKDIRKGEEFLGNYSRYGAPPKWLVDYAEEHNIWESLTFKGYNDYV